MLSFNQISFCFPRLLILHSEWSIFRFQLLVIWSSRHFCHTFSGIFLLNCIFSWSLPAFVVFLLFLFLFFYSELSFSLIEIYDFCLFITFSVSRFFFCSFILNFALDFLSFCQEFFCSSGSSLNPDCMLILSDLFNFPL